MGGRSWRSHTYSASLQLDVREPTWAKSTLEEMRLPRWMNEGHDRGAAVFVDARHLRPVAPLPLDRGASP